MLFRTMAALLVTMGVAAAAQAQTAASQVAIDGCPTAGSQASCLMVTTADNKMFDISVAGHKPDIGRAVHVTGMTSANAGACQQGTRVVGLTWTYTGQRCPIAK